MYNLKLTAWSGRALNSAVECHLHTVEVAGSNPAAPTILLDYLATLKSPASTAASDQVPVRRSRPHRKVQVPVVSLMWRMRPFYGWLLAIALVVGVRIVQAQTASSRAEVRNRQVWLSLSCGDGCLWEYGPVQSGSAYKFSPPVFAVGGKQITARVSQFVQAAPPVVLDNGAVEYHFTGTLRDDSRLKLDILLQINDGTPIVRFRYVLKSDQPTGLTTIKGANSLIYLETSFAHLSKVEEVALSNFVELTHSYTLSEETIDDRYFADRGSVMGPILTASDGQRSFLLAYEHGSTVPDAFLQYQLSPNRSVRLAAVKGNYVSGQTVDADHPYRTIWMETAAVRGGMDELASSYRRFVLKFLTQNLGTRQPYIFYNTWNLQERDRWRNGESYLEAMNEGRILKEIEVAHRMGNRCVRSGHRLVRENRRLDGQQPTFPRRNRGNKIETRRLWHEAWTMVWSDERGSLQPGGPRASGMANVLGWKNRRASESLGDRRELSNVYGQRICGCFRGPTDSTGKRNRRFLFQMGRD